MSCSDAERSVGKLSKTEMDDLICREYPKVKGYFQKRVKAPDDRDDLAQETLGLACKYIHTLSDITKIDAWIYKIAKNVYVKFLSAETKRKAAFDESSEVKERELPLTEMNDLCEYLEKAESDDELRKLVIALGEPYSSIFKLRYVNGLKLAEIAERKNMNVNTVKSLHFRGLKKLKEILEYEGRTP